MTEFTDETLMPWGPHRDTKLENVPAEHLLWLLEQKWIPDWPDLHRYIQRCEDTLRQEVGDSEGLKGDIDGFNDFDDYMRDYRGF